MEASEYNPFGFDLLKGQEHLRRALLIAYVGRFQVRIIDSNSVDEIPRVDAKQMTRWLAKEFSNILFIDFITWPHDIYGDINVELAQPTLDILLRPGNVTACLRDDLAFYGNKTITTDLPLDPAARQMLQTSYNRLRLSVYDTNIVKIMASVIACIDSDIAPTKVEAHHIAEAVHYVIAKYERV